MHLSNTIELVLMLKYTVNIFTIKYVSINGSNNLINAPYVKDKL